MAGQFICPRQLVAGQFIWPQSGDKLRCYHWLRIPICGHTKTPRQGRGASTRYHPASPTEIDALVALIRGSTPRDYMNASALLTTLLGRESARSGRATFQQSRGVSIGRDTRVCLRQRIRCGLYQTSRSSDASLEPRPGAVEKSPQNQPVAAGILGAVGVLAQAATRRFHGNHHYICLRPRDSG